MSLRYQQVTGSVVMNAVHTLLQVQPHTVLDIDSGEYAVLAVKRHWSYFLRWNYVQPSG